MKKILLLLITCMLFSMISFADDTSFVDKAITSVQEGVHAIDTSSTFREIYSDVKSAVSALAKGLKVGAEHVYIVLVKQQVVNAIIYLIVGLIGIFFVTIFIRSFKSDEVWSTPATSPYGGDNPTALGVLRLLQMSIGCILFLVFVFYIDVIVTGFVNPEYGALQEALELVGKMRRR